MVCSNWSVHSTYIFIGIIQYEVWMWRVRIIVVERFRNKLLTLSLSLVYIIPCTYNVHVHVQPIEWSVLVSVSSVIGYYYYRR